MIGYQLLCHRGLGCLIGGAKGNMVHRSAPERSGGKAMRLMDIDHSALVGSAAR